MTTTEKLRRAASQLPPLSSRELRRLLQQVVPEASERELSEALYRMGFSDDGR